MRAVLSHLRLKALQQRLPRSMPATATKALSNEAQHCYKFGPCCAGQASAPLLLCCCAACSTILTQQVPASITYSGCSHRSGGGTEAAADKEEAPTVPGTLFAGRCTVAAHTRSGHNLPPGLAANFDGLQWQQDRRRRASGRSQVVSWTRVSRSTTPQHASCRRRRLSTRVMSSWNRFGCRSSTCVYRLFQI